MIPCLARVFCRENSNEILHDICWALSYASDGGAEYSALMLQTPGVTNKLCELSVVSADVNIKMACLRTIGNILTGND